MGQPLRGAVATLLLLTLVLAGCSTAGTGTGTSTGTATGARTDEPQGQTGEGALATPPPPQPSQTGASLQLPTYQAAFLQPFDLAVEGRAEHFTATVSQSWGVPLGSYPEGLYWQLADVFSRDAGLPLEPLKGQQVDVWRYGLQGGLPGEGPNAEHRYPSNLVLLTQQERVVGAWLEFNGWGVGPSLRKRSLQDLTGHAFRDWVDEAAVFKADGNEDLQSMEPAQVVDAFLKAVTAKDAKRAHACLSPAAMLSALAVNRVPAALYDPGFGPGSSLADGILRGRLLSWQQWQPAEGGGFGAPAPANGSPTIELTAEVEIRWRDDAFNSPTGRETRFVGMTKTRLGWKIDGMGTGP